MLRRMILGAMAFAMGVMSVNAAAVDQEMATTAANRFLQTSSMAAQTLPDRTVEAVWSRGNLWIVRLAPSGHILIAGSDRATPIIGFSENDFSEGEEDSAERAMLDAADAAVAAAEADETKGRHKRWESLLTEQGTRKSTRRLLGTAAGVNIEPFVTTRYNQNQPWNDLTPVTSKNSDYIWRGRSCAGCVSIADAAIYRELRWPIYPARTETITHNLRGESFAIRFDGSEPFEWDKIYDTYSFSGDMRGQSGAEEDKRYEIGRYILWLNQSASMSYNSGESTSTKSTAAHGCERDWYSIGRSMSPTEEGVVDKVTQTLEAGIPVFVGVKGHAVVCDGWKVEDDADYVDLVYGWGAAGSWYSLETGPVRYFWVEHYPRAKPQLDPIPRVVGDSVTLSWHFPDCYTNNLTGFTIKGKRRTSADIVDWTADFSAAATGSASPANIWFATNNYGAASTALDAEDLTYGFYQFSTPLTITSDSELSFKIRGGAHKSGDACKDNVVIEICGEDGNWHELMVPEINWAYWPGSWKENTKSLSDYAGQTVQLRIYKRHATYNGHVAIGDFKVTNVVPLTGDEVTQNVAATARSASVTELVSGADYAFSVTPVFDEDHVEVAGYSVIPEPSDAKAAASAGTHIITGEFADYTIEDFTTNNNATAELALTFNKSVLLTKDSTLSCNWYADCSKGAVLQLKVTFTPDGGDEEPVYETTSPKMKMGQYLDQSGDYIAPESAFNEGTISLAQYKGRSGVLKAFIHVNEEYVNKNIASSIVTSMTVTQVRFAGDQETETLTVLSAPTIKSIKYGAIGGSSADFGDGYLADGSIGDSVLQVTCSENVTELTATPSHVELVKDENVHVTKVSDGNWEVTFDPVIPANRDRQRMILTLHATDSNGTTVHRDVVMRMTEDKIVVGEGEPWEVDEPYTLTRSLLLSGGTVTANGTLAINQNSISSFTVVSNSTISGTGSLCISNSNATITFENSAMLTNGLNIESNNVETLTLAGTGTFVQGAGTTIKVYSMTLGSGVLLNLNLTSDQSPSEAIVQFGENIAAISDWKLRIHAPVDMPSGTYPLVYASTYVAKPNTIYLPTLDRDCSVEVKNGNTLCFVVGDLKAEQFTNTNYPVPYSWFTDDMGVDKDFISTVMNSEGSGKSYKWWECYVLGLDPMNSTSVFTATAGTSSVLEFSPTNTELVASGSIVYVLQGSTDGESWHDCEDFYTRGAGDQHFRVAVKWTKGETDYAIYSDVVNIEQTEHSVASDSDWFEENIDAQYTRPQTLGASYSEPITIEDGALKVDRAINDPLFYTPPSYMGNVENCRIETVIKALYVHASTNSLPVEAEEWGSEGAPCASIAAAVNDGATATNWYGWTGMAWTNLVGNAVEGNTYTNAIEFTLDDGDRKASYYVNGDKQGETVSCMKNGVAIKGLPLGTKLGFAGYGEFQSFLGKGVSKLVVSTIKTQDQLVELGLDKDEGETVTQALMRKGANDLPQWQSLVLGLNPSERTSRPFVAPVQNGDADKLSFTLGNYVENNNLQGVNATFHVYEVNSDGEEVDGSVFSDETSLGGTATIDANFSEVKYFKIKITFESAQ